jgi:hypothetical protein
MEAFADFIEQEEYPRGFKWGKVELESLKFALQAEIHPFEDLRWKHEISKENLYILQELKRGFGLSEDEWTDKFTDDRYEDFYDTLAEMVPRVEGTPTTEESSQSDTELRSPRRTRARNPVPFPSSSPPESRKEAPSDTAFTTIDEDSTKHEFKLDNLPILTRKRQWDNDNIESPRLPPLLRTPTTYTPLRRQWEDLDQNPAFLNASFNENPSSPISSPTLISNTIPQTPLPPQLPSRQTTNWNYPNQEEDDESETSDESYCNRTEDDLTTRLIFTMIKRICDTHGECDGFRFVVGYKIETLAIPICGQFIKSIPDLRVRMFKDGVEDSIVDYKGRRRLTLDLLCSCHRSDFYFHSDSRRRLELCCPNFYHRVHPYCHHTFHITVQNVVTTEIHLSFLTSHRAHDQKIFLSRRRISHNK